MVELETEGVEKTGAGGELVARLCGAVLVAAGVYVATAG